LRGRAGQKFEKNGFKVKHQWSSEKNTGTYGAYKEKSVYTNIVN